MQLKLQVDLVYILKQNIKGAVFYFQFWTTFLQDFFDTRSVSLRNLKVDLVYIKGADSFIKKMSTDEMAEVSYLF